MNPHVRFNLYKRGKMISKLQHLLSFGESDHLVLTFNFICYTENIQENINRTRFKLFKGDYQSIRVQLEQTDWDGRVRWEVWKRELILVLFRTFVRFALVWFCLFPLPPGVWEGLRFMIVALPGLFSYLFLDLSGSWARFTELHKEFLEKYIPESRPCQSHVRSNPFIDQTCLDAIKVKHRKGTKYKHCKSQENFKQFKIARSNITSYLRITKYNYEKI